MDDFELRLERAYAALDAARETDHSKFQITRGEHQGMTTIGVDFAVGMTEADISNLAHSAVHNVANLRDHAIRRARQRKVAVSIVDEVVSRSLAVQVIIDLSNNDKHGYPPRDGGKSGRSPKLINIERFMSMDAGTWTGIRFEPQGVVADGRGPVLTSGTVVDQDDVVIGELHMLLNEALAAWESVLPQLS
jgi:hypothetical protein